MGLTDLATKPWLSAYAADVPQEIAPVTQSLVDMMQASIRDFDSRVALEFFGASTSYRQLGQQIERAASGLRAARRAAGRPGRARAAQLPAARGRVLRGARLGAIVVEHNPLYTERELRHQFDDHGATVAIVWDKVAQTVLDFPDAMA